MMIKTNLPAVAQTVIEYFVQSRPHAFEIINKKCTFLIIILKI